jgi:putative FmdB family regulatory protein
MPFYEYQCNSCGHSLEAMQKVSDPPLKKCPHCGKPQLQKLMSAPVFRLKGAGWYETDFKSDQDNKRNLADRPEADAPKDDKKEAAEAAPKEAGSAETAKPSDATPSKGPEKAAEKTAPTDPVKKPAAAVSASGRGAASSVNKSSHRKSVKRPARHAVKRNSAKPARRR